MHERSLVSRLIEQIEDELRIRQRGGLTAVRLEIGEFAGVEPSLLELAFQEMAADRWQRDVELRLDVVPLTARCQRCGEEFHVERFRFVCPKCDHAAVDVIAGEDLRLVSLTMDSIPPPHLPCVRP